MRPVRGEWAMVRTADRSAGPASECDRFRPYDRQKKARDAHRQSCDVSFLGIRARIRQLLSIVGMEITSSAQTHPGQISLFDRHEVMTTIEQRRAEETVKKEEHGYSYYHLNRNSPGHQRSVPMGQGHTTKQPVAHLEWRSSKKTTHPEQRPSEIRLATSPLPE